MPNGVIEMPIRCSKCDASMHQHGNTKILLYPAGDCLVEEKTRKLYCPNGCKQSGTAFGFETNEEVKK